MVVEDNSQAVDSGLACLIMLSRLHGLPADAGQLRHQFGRSGEAFNDSDILRAAKSLGLKARVINSDWSRLQNTKLPAIAIHKEGHYFIIGKITEDKVLIQDPTAQGPLEYSQDEFMQIWAEELILITRRAGILSEIKKFDFSWFIPAILKYKKLLGEVLLASFFLQIFALITPLFFMVVVDKVLVHRGLSTLDVLAFGLLVVSIFEVVLGGLRTYVFSHTTSRIDVTLGADLFKHLLRLPLNYFEARRVGDTVARVRELDSIRNFITGSALTLVIDLLFTVVFFIALFLFSPTLTYIVLGTIPFYIILAFLVTPVLRARLHEKFKRGADNQAFPGGIGQWDRNFKGQRRGTPKPAPLGTATGRLCKIKLQGH